MENAVEIKINSKRDCLFVLFSFITAFLFTECILFGGFGIAVPVFIAAFYALCVTYIGKKNLHLTKDAVLTLIPVILLSSCFILYNNEYLRFFNLNALLFFIMLNISYLTAENNYPFFSAGTLWDFIKALFVYPFSNLDKSITVLSQKGKKSAKLSNTVKILLGILIISPVALVILSLLISSDAAFQQVMSSVTYYLKAQWSEYIVKVFVSVILMFPIFSYFFSLHYKNRNYKISEESSKQIQFIDPVIVNAALWVICFIYIIYIAAQFSYFFSAMRSMLPGGFTYSGYARRGFFELAAVCFLNLLLIIASSAFSKKTQGKDRLNRITTALLSLLTILLAAAALSKMFLYIGFYGLTLLRVYTSWFMAALAFTFAFVIIKCLRPKFNVLKVTAITVTALYLALNFANVDALIPAYNIQKYEKDPSKGLDVSMLNELSDSMVPQATKLLNDSGYKAEAEKLLLSRKDRLDRMNRWQDFNLASYNAKNVMNELAAKGIIEN